MKAISIRQPFASRIMRGTKRTEWRSWRPSPDVIGARIAVHASLLPDTPAAARLPRGVVLGSVVVTGVRWSSKWQCWGWQLADPEALRRPVPAKGKLRI